MNVLFLCTGNSCRSQIAEAYGHHFAAGRHGVYSAGTFPKGIHPRTEETLAEDGLGIAGHASKDVDAVPVDELDLVITLCTHADENLPPALAAVPRRHWDLEDPADASGSEEEVRATFREIRQDIRGRVESLFAVS